MKKSIEDASFKNKKEEGKRLTAKELREQAKKD
jgi:hypothetical protein